MTLRRVEKWERQICVVKYLFHYKFEHVGSWYIHAEIDDVLNAKKQPNTEHLSTNLKYAVKKCSKFGI